MARWSGVAYVRSCCLLNASREQMDFLAELDDGHLGFDSAGANT